MSSGRPTAKPAEGEERREYRGLCATCRNAPHCTFARSAEQIVLQCEEFEGYAPAPRSARTMKVPESTPPLSRTENSDAERMGLCKTCASSETCAFSKPEGGVWHCEEYR